MNAALIVAGAVAVAAGCAHSFLGERDLLVPLFRRERAVSGSGTHARTQRTLRVTWHLLTIAWWGSAALLFTLAGASIEGGAEGAVRAVGVTFAVSGAVVLLASRGRHLAWLALSAVAGAAWAATL